MLAASPPKWQSEFSDITGLAMYLHGLFARNRRGFEARGGNPAHQRLAPRVALPTRGGKPGGTRPESCALRNGCGSDAVSRFDSAYYLKMR